MNPIHNVAEHQVHQGKPMTANTAKQRILWVLGVGALLVNADNRAITPMLPAIAEVFGTTASAAALLVTAYSIPYGLFQLAYGPLADRVGKVKTILCSLCLFALGTIACGFVDSYGWLLALRFITGMFAAGIIPTTLALIGDQYDLAERPRAIAFFMSLSTTGQALGIAVGGVVAQFASYRALFIMLGIMAVPTLWALFMQRKRDAVQQVETLPLRSRYLALLRSRRAWMIYSLVFLEGFLFFAGFTFLGVYGVDNLHLSYLAIGLLTVVYSAGAFIGSRTITWVLQRTGAPNMPILGSLLMALGFAVIWVWPSVTALSIGFIVLGFGFSYCHSTLQTYATDLLPQARATAMSVFAFSLFLGSGLGPIAGGWIFDLYGVDTMLGTTTVGLVLLSMLCTPLRKMSTRTQAG
ncbi:MFS transporter [Paenibacillus xerothermodurans]|uniref:MFS transporter n=1 Tax=Paenibacillus xerothermodurans TaxID=1977292 RepID=A0A2W1NM70_PAEXE|nr:MFS transporter [Paenibacillus xerothermodurans]PZE20555.1 MFS transporter [Paenibacillus xerothermodurans]